MIRGIRLYFEGDRALRTAMGDFLKDVRAQASAKKIRWEIIASGPRVRAYRNFCDALVDYPDSFNVLLVDSETPVVSLPWDHLQNNTQDRWSRPTARDEQCHLMVQVMESWFLADREALQKYYGKGFNANALPGPINVETHDKIKILNALKLATLKTNKREYHKTEHAGDLLKMISSKVVRQASPHCERLFSILETTIASL